ncbi:MAG: hypothetical protein O7E52_27695 [Candidatus Poribacteria bacterium]|nr:hypothetical protein [Candidatus Poribacteria bacterium]
MQPWNRVNRIPGQNGLFRLRMCPQSIHQRIRVLSPLWRWCGNLTASGLMVLISLSLYCGCGSSVTRVPIQIQVQSMIDANQYSSFAVLPFIEDERSDSRHIKVDEEIGRDLSSLMRIGLGRHQNFDVVSTNETLRMLTGETLNVDLLSNVDELVRIGQYFEVDAVIGGSYTFFAVSEPRRYYGERYSRELQRYVTDYQDYLQKTYVLSLRIVIAGVDTEEIIRDDRYDRRAVEAHTTGSFLISEIMPSGGVLKNLAKQAISEFTRQIAPHHEIEERFLVR